MSNSSPRSSEPLAAPGEPETPTVNTGVAIVGAPTAPSGTVPSNHPDKPHPAVAGPTRLGEYTVLELLGEGGMGAVYLAEDSKLGRKVAIKTLKPEFVASASDRDRFVREARAAAKVEHDNIVPVWGVGETDGAPFIVMPFLQGETLDARLKREPAVALGAVLKVAKEVADGLAAAHAKGLIHRDVKPGNIWLEGEPSSNDLAQQIRRCKILDFGLARSVDKEDAQITASGAILGTPAYMAPEQARGERVDHRADLFSLGVTLYRMATGKPPFSGPTPMAVLIALTTEPPRPMRELNPNLPPALTELIDRLMSKNPDARPKSAAEVSAAVRQIVKDLRAKKVAPEPEALTGVLPAVRVVPLPDVRGVDPDSGSVPRVLLPDDRTDPDPSREPPKEMSRRSRAPWLIAVAVGLLALIPLGWWLATRGDKPDPNTAKVEAPPKAKDDEPPKAKEEGPPKTKAEESPKAKDDGPKPAEVPKQPDPNADPERTAALYVRSIGGCIWVDDDEKEIKASQELPKQPFRLTRFQLLDDRPPTEKGLAAFAGCRNLLMLGLSDLPVGDAVLTHFKECKGLGYLYLSNTRVTSEGLVAFADCTRLLELNLTSCPGVDDKILPQLKRYTELHHLSVAGTKLTPAGLAELGKALPRCQIDHDGGTIKPTKK